jgi:hypothetical protein
MAGIRTQSGRHIHCPVAWYKWRSDIKEESLALGQHGGQSRSYLYQATGRTQHQVEHNTGAYSTPHVPCRDNPSR